MQINRKALLRATTFRKFLMQMQLRPALLRLGSLRRQSGGSQRRSDPCAGSVCAEGQVWVRLRNTAIYVFSYCCSLRRISGRSHTFILLWLWTQKLKWISTLELFSGQNMPVFVWKSMWVCFLFPFFYSLWFNLLVLWLQHDFSSGQGGGWGISVIASTVNDNK